jgi:hypothetical protein
VSLTSVTLEDQLRTMTASHGRCGFHVGRIGALEDAASMTLATPPRVRNSMLTATMTTVLLTVRSVRLEIVLR